MDVVKVGEYDKMSPLLPVSLKAFEQLLKHKNNRESKLQRKREKRKIV